MLWKNEDLCQATLVHSWNNIGKAAVITRIDWKTAEIPAGNKCYIYNKGKRNEIFVNVRILFLSIIQLLISQKVSLKVVMNHLKRDTSLGKSEFHSKNVFVTWSEKINEKKTEGAWIVVFVIIWK